MLLLITAVPHRPIRQPKTTYRLGTTNSEPDFNSRILLSRFPTCRKHALHTLGQRCARIDPPVAVSTAHLRDEAVCRFPSRLRVNAVMNLKKLVPMNLPRPVSNVIQINGW